MSNLHLRRLDEKLFQQLKDTASHQNVSVNTLVLNLIRQGLGLSQRPRTTIYHDLDRFAATWTSTEAKAFMKNISDFEKIDEDLWK